MTDKGKMLDRHVENALPRLKKIPGLTGKKQYTMVIIVYNILLRAQRIALEIYETYNQKV